VVSGYHPRQHIHPYLCTVSVFSLPGVLTLVDKSQWKAQPTEGQLNKLVHPTKYVIVQHSATYSCKTNEGCEILMRSIQNNHINNDDIGDDIGYNFVIGGNGLVYEGRGWDTVGAHTRGWNSASIGVAFLGNFQKEVPNPAYFDALDCLIREGVRLKKLDENYRLVYAAQVQDTLSPGKHVNTQMKKHPHFYSVEDQLFVNDPSKE
ncbi:peptidoglycan-recognition protein 2-like, partial [Nilaparvata lugens]|uniref:peptidoglycan-recognition protein 2-like n=1 Tax=Nilaparvata lugens TaxID=108931 RepID=UPI00193C970E